PTGIDPNLYSTIFITRPVPLDGVMPNTLTLNFDSSFRPEDPGTQFAHVEVSFDGGSSWTELLEMDTSNTPGGVGSLYHVNDHFSFGLDNPGSGTAQFRFSYLDAGNDWWWALDNIEVTGDRTDRTSISAVSITNPTNGKVAVAADGSFTYTPNAGFTGTDSFTYKANDGMLSSNVATVKINVVAANPNAPVANNDRYNVTQATAVTVVDNFGVLANDTD